MSLVFDIGNITDWITALTAIVASIFAWKGYMRLINDSKDTAQQIKFLASQAVSLATFVDLEKKRMTASRNANMPKFVGIEPNSIQGKMRLVGLVNVGGIAMNVRLTHVIPVSNDHIFKIIRKESNDEDGGHLGTVNNKEPIVLQWIPDGPAYHYHPNVHILIEFGDIYGYEYMQSMKWATDQPTPLFSTPTEFIDKTMTGHTVPS